MRGLSIRAKVGLAALLLLAIPWIGYRYVVEMENHLRGGLEETVAGAAAAIAGALHDRPDLLAPADPTREASPADIEVFTLGHPPEIDGYEATRRLRAQGYSQPIVALTANARAEDRRQALQSGMDDHVAKPVSPAQLAAVLHRWSDRAHPASHSAAG